MTKTKTQKDRPLTQSQKYMLEELGYSALGSPFDMLIVFGPRWRQTWRALEDRGLVRYCPRARHHNNYRLA